jgi:gas vesicle structural protein
MQRAVASVFVCDEDFLISMAESASNLVIASGEPNDDLSLLDVLDHILNKGVVIRGKLIISLAGVDLIYLGLDVLLTSVETALKHLPEEATPRPLSPSTKAEIE